MVFIYNIVKKVNHSCIISKSKLHGLPKSHVFSSMPLQSGIFTINRNFIIGLVSSIITAAMGYVIRLILLNYLEYDVFTNLDNLIASSSYFCSLGGIRFVINEYLKENTFLMSYCGGARAVSNNTAGSGSLPVGGNAAGYNSFMQAPDQPGIGSSSAGHPSITNDRSNLEQRINRVQAKVHYFEGQLGAAQEEFNEILSKQSVYEASGRAEQWQRLYLEKRSAVEDSYTNLHSESRMQNILQTKLENGDYSISATSANTKRRFNDSSMAKDDSSTPTNTKRTADDR